MRKRLIARGSENEEEINQRVDRAEYEMTFRPDYDHVVVNDKLPEAIAEVESLMSAFIKS